MLLPVHRAETTPPTPCQEPSVDGGATGLRPAPGERPAGVDGDVVTEPPLRWLVAGGTAECWTACDTAGNAGIVSSLERTWSPAALITDQVMPDATVTTQAQASTPSRTERLVTSSLSHLLGAPCLPPAYRANMTSILVVEDDPGIHDALARGLTEQGHAVTVARDGLSALELVIKVEPDVVLLDLGLPDVDGLQVLAMLRGLGDTPVIVITAQDDDKVLVKALDAGADDYVVKPFGLEQIAARIRAVLRRGGSGTSEAPLVVGELVVDSRTRSAQLAGDPLELSRKEFDLFDALASRSGEVVSKRALLAEVWQQAYGGGERTVDVHLSWLRRKLGETAAQPRYLYTVRGVGVRLVAPEAEASDV